MLWADINNNDSKLAGVVPRQVSYEQELAEKFGFNVHIGLFDPQIYQKDFFDYITLDQVLEHIQDPVLILKGIKKILRPGGTVVISTPNANGWGARFFKRKWVFSIHTLPPL